MFSLLLFLSCTVCNCNLTMSLFHSSVAKHLLTAHVLLLKSPQTFLLLLVCLLHFSFSNLLSALMQNCILLLLTKTFKVVGLHSVWGKHRPLSRRIFSHEVMIESELLLSCSSLLASFECSIIPVSLLNRHLIVSILICDEHFLSNLRMLLLSLF
jgi:hypothetical protein